MSKVDTTQVFTTILPLKNLIEDIVQGTCDLDANYHRPYCWTPAMVEEFLQALLQGLSFNLFITYHEDDHYEIIDGYQRLKTLFMFSNDEIKLGNIASKKIILTYLDEFKHSEKNACKKIYSRFMQSNVVTRLTYSLLPETVIAKLNATQVPVLKIISHNQEPATYFYQKYTAYQKECAHLLLDKSSFQIFNQPLECYTDVITPFCEKIHIHLQMKDFFIILFQMIGVYDNSALRLGCKNDDVIAYINNLNQSDQTYIATQLFEKVLKNIKLVNQSEIKDINLRKSGLKLVFLYIIKKDFTSTDISKVLMNIQKVQNQAKYFNTSKNIDLHDVLKTSDERKINDIRSLCSLFKGMHKKQVVDNIFQNTCYLIDE